MRTSQFPPSLATLIALVGTIALLSLTGCQSSNPPLGVGVPIEDLPPQQGVPLQ